jgi:zinc transport system ATP-binding protein
MAHPSLVVHNCSFGYQPSEQVLRNVSFTVQRGQFLGIIGPNGGGKSTLLKLILGLLSPQKGTIRINGHTPPTVGVGYVPQAFQFDRRFPITAFEVVLGGRTRSLSLFGRYNKRDEEAAQAALHRVGLSPMANHPFGALSGGQAQRVLIARALVSEPTVLLLDEPTSSSDPEAESSILETIHSLKSGMTILMVTHNLEAILSHVEGILCVQGGAAMLHPKEVCEHFALGLYHIPLIQTPKDHFMTHKQKGTS